MERRKIKILEIAAVDVTIYFLLMPLMEKLRESGYTVEASCSKGNFSNKISERGFEVYDIPISRNLNFFKHILSVGKLLNLMRSKKYDIVHVHTPIGAFIGRIAAKLAGIPIVIYTIHGFYFHENMTPFKRNIVVFIEKVLSRWTTFAFSQSAEDTNLAVEKHIFPSEKILTIGNGVDINFFKREVLSDDQFAKKRASFDIPVDGIVVTCVARMNKEKGIFDLLRAAETVIRMDRSVHFLFVGGIFKGNEPNAISEKFIKDYFRENPSHSQFIRFLGTRTDIKNILSISDIFVLPSYREGMPRSIIEAMAMELPVIATNIRGSREEVVDGETGILVPVGDIKALSSAIIKLARDPELRDKMGKKGRERVEKYFDEEKVIEKQLKIIQKLLQKYRTNLQ